MIIPVRCFTCNKVIGHLWESFNQKIAEYMEQGFNETESTCKTLDELELPLYCCRRMLLGHIDVIDTLLLYSNNPYEKVDPRLVQGLYQDLKPDPNSDTEEEISFNNKDEECAENYDENGDENYNENGNDNYHENGDEEFEEQECEIDFNEEDDECIIDYDDD